MKSDHEPFAFGRRIVLDMSILRLDREENLAVVQRIQ